MGPSGCKDTVAHRWGCSTPDERNGSVTEVTDASYRDRPLAASATRESLGFQVFHLITLTFSDNVQIPLLYRLISNAEQRKRPIRALDRVGLSARSITFLAALGGQQTSRHRRPSRSPGFSADERRASQIQRIVTVMGIRRR